MFLSSNISSVQKSLDSVSVTVFSCLFAWIKEIFVNCCKAVLFCSTKVERNIKCGVWTGHCSSTLQSTTNLQSLNACRCEIFSDKALILQCKSSMYGWMHHLNQTVQYSTSSIARYWTGFYLLADSMCKGQVLVSAVSMRQEWNWCY